MEDKYKLRYLPLFEEELINIVNHIKYNLGNPSAAKNLITEVEKAIIKRFHSPLSFSRAILHTTESMSTIEFM